MPSCKSSDAVRVKPWLAHTPQPDEPPPDQPGEPDVPPIGDPPEPPGEVPHAVHPSDPSISFRLWPSRRAAQGIAWHAPAALRASVTAFMY